MIDLHTHTFFSDGVPGSVGAGAARDNKGIYGDRAD